jgi:nucleoside-diphosphate-sugar epimerase
MKPDISKILVTGSSGTIGTALCERLMSEGYQVAGADIRHNKWNEAINQITTICDLRDRNFFTALPTDFDLLIHLAANARVFNLVKEPILARDNFEISFNVLEFCQLSNIKRFIFASSREVYGNSPNRICYQENEVNIEGCESPYAATKMAGEALVAAYRQCYGIEYVILRFSNVYGKYDESDRIIPLFIERATRGQDLVVFGRDKLLDFTYISDCIDGIMKSIENFDRIKGNTFNIAYGEAVSILEVAKEIQNRTGTGGNLIIKENRTGEVMRFVADISKAKTLLNYEPKVPIAKGIAKTIEYYQNLEKLSIRSGF